MGAPSPPQTSTILGGTGTGFNTQTFANQAAQGGSNYGQINPYGKLNYVQTGTGPNGQPQYTAIEKLSPEQQQLLNTYTGTQNVAGNQANQLLAGANYGSTSPTTAIGDETKGLTSQMMGQWLSGVTPFFKTQQDQLDTKLANQGLGGPTNANPAGSPAWQNAQRELQTNQNLAVAQESAQVEPNAFNQATTLYGLPAQLSEQLAKFGAPTTPNASFNTGAQIQPADYAAMLSATLPAYMQPYQAQYQQYGNLMNGLFGLGSAGILGLGLKASDIRLKENIVPIGKLPNGLNIYSYNFIGKPATRRIGVMAQEVLQVAPEYVVTLPGGFLGVDYAGLLKGQING